MRPRRNVDKFKDWKLHLPKFASGHGRTSSPLQPKQAICIHRITGAPRISRSVSSSSSSSGIGFHHVYVLIVPLASSWSSVTIASHCFTNEAQISGSSRSTKHSPRNIVNKTRSRRHQGRSCGYNSSTDTNHLRKQQRPGRNIVDQGVVKSGPGIGKG